MVGIGAIGGFIAFIGGVLLLWLRRRRRNRTPTIRVEYVSLTYEGADGEEKHDEGWANAVYYPSDMLAIDWYQDDRQEVAQHRIIELEREGWERIEKGGPVPY